MISLPKLELWEKMRSKHLPQSFDLELTARCNNDCRHCYICVPAGDSEAKVQELTPAEIESIARQAASRGAVWCLLTGGEPLLRSDFPDLYLMLRRLGLLVSVFTNAALVSAEHVELFRKHPPRDIEVSVYGATKETYERVTRRPGSFEAFTRGLDLLLSSGVKVRLKAMAMRSNVHELAEIASFCRARTKDYYRFDPVLHLRFDGDPARNELIRAERLTPAEVAAVERADAERFGALQHGCDQIITPERAQATSHHLFGCGTGSVSFTVGHEGSFRLCASLWHPSTVCDLRRIALADAWRDLVPRVRAMQSSREEFLESCRVCPIINLCLCCPAHAYLETGELDARVDYFCQVAHARAESLQAHRNGGVADERG